MEQVYFEGKTFEKTDYSLKKLIKAEFELCSFINCDFSNCDLSEAKFIECKFSGCNLSLLTLNKTILRDVEFRDCKMIGLLFYNCNEFGFSASFTNCNLGNSSFYKMKIKKTIFENCRLKEADFTLAEISESVFRNCDLSDAKFENTNMEKADFTTAFNYIIDPSVNRVKKTRFSLNGLPGLLNKFGIIIEN